MLEERERSEEGEAKDSPEWKEEEARLSKLKGEYKRKHGKHDVKGLREYMDENREIPLPKGKDRNWSIAKEICEPLAKKKATCADRR